MKKVSKKNNSILKRMQEHRKTGTALQNRGKAVYRAVTEHPRFPLFILAATVLLTTGILLVSSTQKIPSYAVGDVAQTNIKAPSDLLIKTAEEPIRLVEGEMLVREGARITPAHVRKLDAARGDLERGHTMGRGLGFGLLITALLVIAYMTHISTDLGQTLYNKDLAFICVMLLFIFALGAISTHFAVGMAPTGSASMDVSRPIAYAFPLASGSMAVCIFMGMSVAVPFALISALSTAFLFGNTFEMALFYLFSAMMAAYWVRNCKERRVLIQAGVKTGLVNIVLATALTLLSGKDLQPTLIWGGASGLIGGLGAGILTTGLIPLIEMVFGYTTNNKLLELANLDYPVLKELTIAAPGTYHHSIIVGSLAEAAATTIGANPLLAKVGGYYHDIGKINKAAYFVENQSSSQNKHDRLAPSMSSLILTTHVRDGVKVARRYRLGKDITDIIQQHHGTNVIAYFYEKAKRLKGKEAVNVDNFRYPGPKPQTKEAALVLLADSVEASSRTMQTPTRRNITTLVRNVINTVVLNGQLDECNLTLKDLNEIAKSFDKTLNGIYHRRIEYPSDNPAPAMDGLSVTGTDANPHRQQTESLHRRSTADKEKGGYPAEGFGVS